MIEPVEELLHKDAQMIQEIRVFLLLFVLFNLILSLALFYCG